MDFVLVEKHETNYGSMDQFGNIVTIVKMIFCSEKSAERELKKPIYNFRGNSTGSVSYFIKEKDEMDIIGLKCYEEKIPKGCNV